MSSINLKINEKNNLYKQIADLEKVNSRIEKGKNELLNIPDKEYVRRKSLENDQKTIENVQKIDLKYRKKSLILNIFFK